MGYFLNRSFKLSLTFAHPAILLLQFAQRQHSQAKLSWETLQSKAGNKPYLYKPSVMCDAACLHLSHMMVSV